jgi:polyferredoxin
VSGDGWWVHIKYYVLLATLLCSFAGILVSGYVAAIPIITRGFLFLTDPIQTGVMRGWHQVPAMNSGHFVSLALFAAVLGLGLLRPRFWCKYVCPSGAVFSLGNLFRLTERKVESTCINCNKCVEVCPFDAIKPDFTTRTSDCTMCQTCGGVCPTQAIKFVDRGNLVQLKIVNDPPTNETALGRRGFLSLVSGTAAAVAGAVGMSAATSTFGANLTDEDSLPVRPPGSVPEQEFLQMCIRCGECYKACPNHVLQAMGFEQGLEGLWTPQVVADWSGCASSCNACEPSRLPRRKSLEWAWLSSIKRRAYRWQIKKPASCVSMNAKPLVTTRSNSCKFTPRSMIKGNQLAARVISLPSSSTTNASAVDSAKPAATPSTLKTGMY